MKSWPELVTWRATHRQQHAPALPHGSAAAQEADDEQEGPHADEHVAHAGQVGQLGRSALHSFQDAQQRGTVHLHPDPHSQDDGTRQLYDTEAQGAVQSGNKTPWGDNKGNLNW